MEKIGNIAWKVCATATLAGALMICGCNSGPRYSDSMSAVKVSLAQNNLADIQVSQDRDKGILTLSGSVPTDDQKIDAVSVTKRTAPTYKIDDEITVVPAK